MMLTQEELDAIEAEAETDVVIQVTDYASGHEFFAPLTALGFVLIKPEETNEKLRTYHARWNAETKAMLQHIKEQAAEIERLTILSECQDDALISAGDLLEKDKAEIEQLRAEKAGNWGKHR